MSARPPHRPKPDTLASVLLGAFLLVIVVPWVFLMLAWASGK